MLNEILQSILLKEFDREMVTTKKILSQVPMEKKDWLPHEKSMALGRLAIHVARLSGMAGNIFGKDEHEFNGPLPAPGINNQNDLLDFFEQNAKVSRDGLNAATDQQLLANWKLKRNGQELFSGPRLLAFQVMMLNHLIHHRAQLGVYLRLNNIPVPGSYGPSADEK